MSRYNRLYHRVVGTTMRRPSTHFMITRPRTHPTLTKWVRSFGSSSKPEDSKKKDKKHEKKKQKVEDPEQTKNVEKKKKDKPAASEEKTLYDDRFTSTKRSEKKKKKEKTTSHKEQTQDQPPPSPPSTTEMRPVMDDDRPSLEELAAINFHVNVTRVNFWRGYLESQEVSKQVTTKEKDADHLDRTDFIEWMLRGREARKSFGRVPNAYQVALAEMDLTPKDLDVLFTAIDHNGDGVIQYMEFTSALNMFGITLHDKTRRGLYKMADTNQDGVIDRQEFQSFMQKVMEVGHFFILENDE